MSRQTDAGRNLPFLSKNKPGKDDTNASIEASDIRRQSVTPTAADEASVNVINPGTFRVVVGAVVNGVTDFITLPSLADVPEGHEITILCNAGGAFEMRTPALSGELINSVDSDGTQEYLCTDTQIIKVVKVSDADGWMAHAFSALGAVVTAVIPD